MLRSRERAQKRQRCLLSSCRFLQSMPLLTPQARLTRPACPHRPLLRLRARVPLLLSPHLPQ